LGKQSKRYIDNPWRYMVFELYMESEVSPLCATLLSCHLLPFNYSD